MISPLFFVCNYKSLDDVFQSHSMIAKRKIYIKLLTHKGVSYKFLLLHHFKIMNSNYFRSDDNNSEALYGNTPNKYSILGFLDDSFKIHDNFVFLLEYPDGNCSYFFEQTKNPLTAEPDEDVEMKNKGLECVGFMPFSGFTQSRISSATVLDGWKATQGTEAIWHFPIGQKVSWDGADRIPAYDSILGVLLTEVNLWIQINDMPLLLRFGYNCSMKHFSHLYTSSFVYFIVKT